IMIALAPAAMALTISPEYLIPPSAMTGTPLPLTASAHSYTADSCGTPTPAITRVVQILPGPTPTLMASAPASARATAASAVAMLPTITSKSGNSFFTFLHASMTPLECPWAVSMEITSTPADFKASILSMMSPVTPTAAPTLNLPYSSLQAWG